MEIIFHAHHAAIPPRLRRRAELALHRTARRLSRAVDAIVRFEQDGPTRRVEIVLHAPRHRNVIALGEARFYGLALTAALEKLSTQVRKLRAGKTGNRKRAAAVTRRSLTAPRTIKAAQA